MSAIGLAARRVNFSVDQPGPDRGDADPLAGDFMAEPDRAHRLAHMVPMKRVGQAEEIANAIVWLMSDEASYVTAATLDVSGGR